ncbi:histidine phosphatase family protein [Candidatus Woesearchaeota archaeon]|nr:histidine phosphatase family protein [Candidatus Woesearchaeota archaeon]
MTKEIWMCRHGQSYYNLWEWVQGQKHSRLTQLGINQAHDLGHELRNERFDRILGSDRGRAIETQLTIVAHLFYVPKREYTPDLRERGYGHMQGMSYKEAGIDKYAEAELYPIDQEGIFYDIEPLKSVRKRTKRIKERIIKSKDKKTLIVAHEWINSYLMNELLEEEISKETFHAQKNCAVSYFRLGKNGKVLEYKIAA